MLLVSLAGFAFHGVSADQAPVMNCAIIPLSGSVGLAVQGEVGGYDPDGLIMLGAINWGDGTSSSTPVSGPIPSGSCGTGLSPPPSFQATFLHTYQTGGSYIMTYYLVDNGGLAVNQHWTITIADSSGGGSGTGAGCGCGVRRM